MIDLKPKRRWFQFSLRTMFVVITAFGVWLGWQFHVIQNRKALIKHLESNGGTIGYSGDSPLQPKISWFRQLLGDRAVQFISLGNSDAPSEPVKAVFPEADIIRTYSQTYP
jgi:hypothetical protein